MRWRLQVSRLGTFCPDTPESGYIVSDLQMNSDDPDFWRFRHAQHGQVTVDVGTLWFYLDAADPFGWQVAFTAFIALPDGSRQKESFCAVSLERDSAIQSALFASIIPLDKLAVPYLPEGWDLDPPEELWRFRHLQHGSVEIDRDTLSFFLDSQHWIGWQVAFTAEFVLSDGSRRKDAFSAGGRTRNEALSMALWEGILKQPNYWKPVLPEDWATKALSHAK
jgi:hypothetical protein